jgi:hypothetical protein
MLLLLSREHEREAADHLVERRPELPLLTVRHDRGCAIDLEDHFGPPGVLFFRVGHFCRCDAWVVLAQAANLLLGWAEQSVRYAGSVGP